MATQRKPKSQKKKKPENENYEFVIDDFDVDYHFGVNLSRDRIYDGNYWEGATINLNGKVTSPKIKNINKAVIALAARHELNEHWKDSPQEKPPNSIGMMQILNDNETLHSVCFVPSQSFPFIISAVVSGKVKFATIYGEKLRWRRAFISYFNIFTKLEDDI